MPAGRASQRNSMLYTVITFAGLFILAIIASAIFYLQAAEYKKVATDSKKKLADIASDSEVRQIGSIVGTKKPRQSRLGTMSEYLDRTVSLILGGPLDETSAEMKAEEVEAKVFDLVDMLNDEPLVEQMLSDPNDFSLARAVEVLKKGLENSRDTALFMENQRNQLQDDFDQTRQESMQKEESLLSELTKAQRRADDVQQSYNKLKAQMELSADEQLQTLMDRVEQAELVARDVQNELLENQSELNKAIERIEYLRAEIDVIKPQPDSEVAAFMPDGKVVSVDIRTNIAVINLGAKEHVYRGLTFSVYDKSAPISKTGQGKAEIEVLDVLENISVARIVTSEKKNPVMADDKIANLIWDAEATNVFVVAGSFDFDENGVVERGGATKVRQLIENWGGRVADAIGVDTDFLVLGSTPRVPPKPTLEQMALDPVAMEKYKQALDRAEQYRQISNDAKTLSVPVFNLERFLYFIGYKSLANRTQTF